MDSSKVALSTTQIIADNWGIILLALILLWLATYIRAVKAAKPLSNIKPDQKDVPPLPRRNSEENKSLERPYTNTDIYL